MNDTSTETTPEAERQRLTAMAEAGRLIPATFQRLVELNEQAAAGQPRDPG